MPHGAKPPNGESLETQKPKCPLSDSRRSVGSPRGVHFSFCFPKLSPPPFLLLSSFLSSFFPLSSPGMALLAPAAPALSLGVRGRVPPTRGRPAVPFLGSPRLGAPVPAPVVLQGPAHPHWRAMSPMAHLWWRLGAAVFGSGRGRFPRPFPGSLSPGFFLPN